VPLELFGDALRIRQVLLKLAENAVKFTEQGSVELSVQVCQVQGRSVVQFEVRDTGIGISRRRSAAAVPVFRAVGQWARAPLWRQRPGAGDRPAAGRADGRRIFCESEEGRGAASGSTFRLP
jgi:light-regulated signal transduction histidine kinase (bacteriophytochrome)